MARMFAQVLALVLMIGAAGPGLAQDGNGNGGGGGAGGGNAEAGSNAGAAAESFQDWGKVCEEVPRRDEQLCYLAQTIEFSDRDLAVEISVGRLVADHDGLIAVVRVPTGVDLGAGLALRVDDTEQVSTDYDVCLERGCQAFVDLQDRGLLSKMRAGKVLHIGFVAFGGTDTQVIRGSLKGFTAGIEAIGG